MMCRASRFVIAAVLALVVFAAPVNSVARTTVTVQFAYGGLVAGGVGAFVYFAAVWELPLAPLGLPTALIEHRDGTTRLGVPWPCLRPGTDAGDRRSDGLQFELIRWRF